MGSMLDRYDATRQPVGMVDNELAGPNPRKTGALGSDYPQDKQRKETGLARKTLILIWRFLPRRHPQQCWPEPRVVWGFPGKKKGPEIIEPFNLVVSRGIEPRSARQLKPSLRTPISNS